MKILIIGGTQFIGPFVVKLLQQQGHEIILFNRGKTPYSFPFEVKSIIGDRTKLSTYKQQLQALQPDIVIDMIPYSEHDAQEVGNTFAGLIKRLVVVSSCDVYQAYDRLWNVITGNIITTPMKENAALRNHFYPYRKVSTKIDDWTYHYDKIHVENIIRSYPNIESTILRLPMVYGPGDYWRIDPYLKQMDAGKSIMLDEQKANWRVTRGYVEDIAYAIVLSALDQRSGNKIYNVGEKNAYSESEWIKEIGYYADWHHQLIKVPMEQLPVSLQEPTLEFKQDLILDTALIRKELHYKELTQHNMAMQRSIDWLRKKTSIYQ